MARRLEGVQASLASAEQRELETAEQLRQTQEDLALKAEENGIMQERHDLAHRKTVSSVGWKESKILPQGGADYGQPPSVVVRRCRPRGGGHGGWGEFHNAPKTMRFVYLRFFGAPNHIGHLIAGEIFLQ